jgi:hypothetical protein
MCQQTGLGYYGEADNGQDRSGEDKGHLHILVDRAARSLDSAAAFLLLDTRFLGSATRLGGPPCLLYTERILE